jgi:hypothetical protein
MLEMDSKPPETIIQWPFQVPKLEVPTIYKAYFFRPKFQGISPENMALYYMDLYGTNVPPLNRILGWPLVNLYNYEFL